MSARRRAGNPDPSSSAMTRSYDLRHRKINAGHKSSDSGVSSLATEPPTPERERRKRVVEQKEKSVASRRTAKPIESDHDDDSDEGSKHSDGSSRAMSEDPRPSHSLSVRSSRSSQTRQSSPPRPSTRHTTAAATLSFLQRPPIRNSADDEGARTNLNDETLSDEEVSQYQPKQIDQLYQSSHYKEQRGSWRSSDRKEESVHHQSYQFLPKETTKLQPGLPKARVALPDDFGKESIVYQRYQPKPKETTKTPQPPSKASVSFSDDEEERRIGYQQKKAALYPTHVEGNKINHYPPKSDRKQVIAPTRPFICFSGRCMKFLALVVLILLVGAAAVFYLLPDSFHQIAGQMKFIREPPQSKKDLKDEFVKLASNFSNQSEETWRRSRIILERHLQMWKENTEPAIILLTGARDAEETLLCLATRLADAYSSPLKGSYTVITGSDWASGSDEEVKERIDERLSEGFQATSRAAVLHRLELLPAGSLLILYKYCDHESAMFKDVALLLTVLLDDQTLDKNISLRSLEDKVRSYLIQTLISVGAKASHDGMDEDKFSGVWSRISHVVLPVFPENNIMEKCPKNQN
ncbi:uncharacterized protein ACNLHF_028253 isoform 2-T2 [Anomaloglossus baeobatrachus]|uniref:uncharacterized protein LOC142249547 isoform X2 n=1 Tax=Anomaloglossus baeobatrachus TaxID=238106 RepID=UPI003F505093